MQRHFLDLTDLSAAETTTLIRTAINAKQRRQEHLQQRAGNAPMPFAGRFLAMLFEHPSTRTRISFAAAMAQGGGQAMVLDADSLQLSRGESAADTARVMSSLADAVMIRARRHAWLEEFAAHATCPVINGLSDRSHPCQVLADMMTFCELRGELRGRKIAWVGDCNNVLFSWAQAAVMLEFSLFIACPPPYRPKLAWPGVQYADSPAAACASADLVMTDVWASMGDEDGAQRRQDFADYSVDAAVMQNASADAIFMHCLPAHRGEEVAAEVIDGRQSAVWQQAENRLYAQQSLLHFLLHGEFGE